MNTFFRWWINPVIGEVIMDLMEHQETAIEQLDNGKILWGNVGSGKSRTVLAYYMKAEAPRDVYVITTAKKRDSLDWEREAARFGIGTERSATLAGTITIDSWNNIDNYTSVRDAFFVFDEQRVVGSGAWVKAFLKIAKNNHWVLLSATPGDTWMDYAPVFVANGYYKSLSDFKFKHVMYEPFLKFPKIRGYFNETKLELLRNEILVEAPYPGENKRVMNWIDVGYDVDKFEKAWKKRWHVYEDRPILDAAERWRVCRRIVNSDPSRVDFIWELINKGVHDKLIVFYNFDYELEILRTLGDLMVVGEYNGHRKDPVPDEGPWVYLVQYTAGAESWNCTTANAMVLYSLNYSYKIFVQAPGRIDRLDTPFKTLYYYILVTNSIIDKAIKGSLSSKKSFNERRFMSILS